MRARWKVEGRKQSKLGRADHLDDGTSTSTYMYVRRIKRFLTYVRDTWRTFWPLAISTKIRLQRCNQPPRLPSLNLEVVHVMYVRAA